MPNWGWLTGGSGGGTHGHSEADVFPVTATSDADTLAQALVGDGVQIVEASLSGGANQAGLFEDGTSALEGVVDFDEGLILSTGKIGSITNDGGSANQSSKTSHDTDGVDGDDDFDGVSHGTGSYDAVYLEIKFVPTSDTISLDIVFGSEEYNEYVYAGYNDSFAAILNEENIALTPDGSPIGIDTINAAGKTAPKYGNDKNDPNAAHDTTDGVFESANESLYVDNAKGTYNTEMDGFTKTISIQGTVIPGEVNTLKIGIADCGDAKLNSWVLIRAGSFSSPLTAEPDAVSVASDGEATLAPLANDVDAEGDTLSVTRINGETVEWGDTVTLAGGQTVILNQDQTLTVQGNDAMPGDDSFTYEVTDTHGNVATGVVSLTTTEPALICFTSGTRILTPGGWVPVERIGIGDLVVTKDKGARAVRWIGKRRVGADRLARQPQLRPIRIERDRMGPGQPRRDLQLSPQHRVLVSGWEADLLFGQAEVLVAAKALGTTVAVAEVTYIHLLFDGHEIVWAEGLACESLHPGDTAMRGLDAASRGEILAIFPELGDEAGRQSRRLARPELKPREFHAVGHLRRAMRSE